MIIAIKIVDIPKNIVAAIHLRDLIKISLFTALSPLFHPPLQEAMASRSLRNAGELRRVPPQQRCQGLLPVGLHSR